MSQPSRKPHHRRPSDAWARIRQDYAAGVPARVAAERGGVSLSALRTRARQEGWRRQDGCGPPPPADWTPDLEPRLEADAALLAEEAWLNAARFTQLGRLSEAAAWARMAAHCRRAAREAEREEAGALSVLPRILSGITRSIGRMHTAEGEAMLLGVCEQVLDAVGELRQLQPSAKPAPECKSQAPVAQQLSAEPHQLHTPPPAPADPADRVPLPRARALGGGQPRSGRRGPLGRHAQATVQSQEPPLSAPPTSPPLRGRETPSGETGPCAAEPPPAPTPSPARPAPPPWTALLARPEADTTAPERCVRRRLQDHRLSALYTHDRPAALRRWSGWVAQFGLDPDRPLTPSLPACVSHPPHLHRGLRAALL